MSPSKVLPAPKPTLLFGPLVKKGISLHRYCYAMAHPSMIKDDFQKESLLLFLNVSGCGELSYHSSRGCVHHLPIAPQKVVLQLKQQGLLVFQRAAHQEHRFFILEMTREWLASLVRNYPHAVINEVHSFLQGTLKKAHTAITPFCSHLRSLSEELLLTHSQEDRPSLWFYAKILELISHTLLEPVENFCCHRKERVALERIESVKKHLIKNFEKPLSLAECARAARCSAAYLSRTFSQYTGMTISRYLRNLRLEQASELLRSGKYNVTEAAMAVGYSSLSHFSKAFEEMFDNCPSCAFRFSLRQKVEQKSATSSPSKQWTIRVSPSDLQGKELRS